MKPAPFTELAVEFVGSFPDATHRLEPRLPEIALLGRSNVGKSSLLNALFGRPLAKTSNTPGRTALLNVFRLPTMYLLDLPGYGFARVSHGERERYQRLVKGLMEKRTTLTGVLWLLDIRHDPSPDDRAYAGTLADRGLPVLVAVTKGDKLPFAQRRRRLAELTRALALEDDQIQLTSSRTGEGIADLAASLLA
ncbi:MAG: ribosome biogenesis GTP-binding protein YihA/YsxC, partial [Gemmatimonadota bacterium]|nr:ribosome biogenesis GTP-binding protein YihA/YsxC [Gemmatimonadota bacterium]